MQPSKHGMVSMGNRVFTMVKERIQRPSYREQSALNIRLAHKLPFSTLAKGKRAVSGGVW
jgi:hypothetical protein